MEHEHDADILVFFTLGRGVWLLRIVVVGGDGGRRIAPTTKIPVGGNIKASAVLDAEYKNGALL